MAVASFQILGTAQLLTLQRDLRRAGHETMRSSMQRRVRRAAEPLRNDLQSTIRNLPLRSSGRKAGGRGGSSPTTRPLRATLAAAVRISVRTTSGRAGARVWVDKSLLPSDLKNMPWAMNSADGRIRHPVFGNRRRWANQHTTPLWWDKTVRRHTPRMQNEIARVLDDVRRQLG